MIRVLDGINAFVDQLASVDPLPVLFAVLAQLAKLGCTSMAWRNVLAAAYPGRSRATAVDRRRVRRRRRRERDHPDASRGRRADLPRTPGDSAEHLHDGRLEHARALDLRHRSCIGAARLGGAHPERAAGARRAPRPPELRVSLVPRASPRLGARARRDPHRDRPPRHLDPRPRGRLLEPRAAGVRGPPQPRPLPALRRDLAGG